MHAKVFPFFQISRLGLALIFAILAVFQPIFSVDARGQTGELKPEVRYDVLKHRLQKAVREKRYEDTVAIVARMRATRFGVRGEILFHEARAHFALKNWAAAHGALVSYLNTVGRQGRNYRAAIALYVEAEGKIRESRRAAEELARAERSWGIAAAAYDAARQQRDVWKSKVITFGGGKDDMGWAMARRVDGGFVVGGTFEQAEDESKDRKPGRRLWLAAIDAKGRMVWNQVIGSIAAKGSVRSLSSLADGGFLVGGVHAGFEIAARTDRNGAVVSDYRGDPWISAYARSKDGAGGIVVTAKDGNIVAISAETVVRDGKQPRLPFSVRLSGEGKTLGKTVYSGEAARYWHDMTEATVLPGGDILAVGESRAQASWDTRPGLGYLLRVKPDGTLVFSRRIAPEGKGDMRLSAVAPARRGGAIVAGHQGNRLLVMRINKDGRPAWRKILDPRPVLPHGSQELCTIPKLVERVQESQRRRNRPLPDADRIAAVRGLTCRQGTPFASAARVVPRQGGYLVLAFQGYGTRQKTDIRLIAVDEEGAVLWDRIYGHDGFDLATSALPTEDGGFIIAGATDSVGTGGRDFLLFKVDASGSFSPWAKLAPPQEEAGPVEAGARAGAAVPRPAPEPQPAPGPAAEAGVGPMPEEGSAGETAVEGSPPTASGEDGAPPATSFGAIFDSVFGGDGEERPESGD